MRLIAIALTCIMLAGCGKTIQGVNDLSSINTGRPQAINCPPVNLVKVSENVYQTDKQGYNNLKTCLSDTIRYIDDVNALIEFYDGRKVEVKKPGN